MPPSPARSPSTASPTSAIAIDRPAHGPSGKGSTKATAEPSVGFAIWSLMTARSSSLPGKISGEHPARHPTQNGGSRSGGPCPIARYPRGPRNVSSWHIVSVRCDAEFGPHDAHPTAGSTSGRFSLIAAMQRCLLRVKCTHYRATPLHLNQRTSARVVMAFKPRGRGPASGRTSANAIVIRM
jgi:hypothetical protein